MDPVILAGIRGSLARTKPDELQSPAALARATRIRGEAFTPWPLQEELWGHVTNGEWVLVLKARQLGVTWAMAVLALWWVLTKPNQTVLILSIGEREAKTVMRRVRLLWRYLPDTLRFRYTVLAESTERFEVDHPDGPSFIVSLPSGGGRGETADLVIGDEAAFWQDADDRLADILPAAADSGQVVLVSTANGDAGRYRDEWWQIDDQALPWRRVFFDPLSRPGRTRESVEAIRRRLGPLGAQEYPWTPEEAFLTSGACPFDAEGLRILEEASCRPALARGSLLVTEGSLTWRDEVGGPLEVWAWPQPGSSYLVAADTASGPMGGDYSHAVVYDQASCVQVAAWHGKPEPREFALVLARLGWYWNTAVVAPEANNDGRAVIAWLDEAGYGNVWRREALDDTARESNTRFGWVTSTTTKPLLVAALQHGVSAGALGVRDRRAVGEMRSFQRVVTHAGNPTWGARDGAHDDRVIAHGIAAALLGFSPQTGEPARRSTGPRKYRAAA